MDTNQKGDNPRNQFFVKYINDAWEEISTAIDHARKLNKVLHFHVNLVIKIVAL